MELITAERALQDAQRNGDLASLDRLLHPQVVGAGPDGTVFGKQDDLDSHASGALRITSLVEQSLEVDEAARTGMTRMVADVEAVQDGHDAWTRAGAYRPRSPRRPHSSSTSPATAAARQHHAQHLSQRVEQVRVGVRDPVLVGTE